VTPPVFYVADTGVAVGENVRLTGDEGRHAADVRRLRVGEAVAVTDGHGVLLRGAVSAVRKGELTITVVERVHVTAPEPRLTVVQALARGGRDEDAVEAMTEVGVDHVIGWEAARNVAHWTDRTQVKWEATARSAAKQSRRAWWPQISGPATTAVVAQRCRAADLALVLHESADGPMPTADLPGHGNIVVVVGPEGGITDEELGSLVAAGASAVRLGDAVLRSSTAGVAALAVLCAAVRWSG
jgi:16S rRNA (uracil1498-N3)-methyltransferase